MGSTSIEENRLIDLLPQYDLKAEPQIGFFEWDLIKDTFKVSKHIVELLAFKTNSVVKTYSEWRELTHPYDIIQTREYMDSVINSKTPYVNLEIRKISRDGTWRYFRVSGIVTKFNKQRSVKISGTIWDVSDIKNTMLEFQKTKNLTGAIKNIIKINKDALSTDDKYLEIIRIFNEATNPKNIMLAFSLKSKPNELNKNSIFTNDSIVDATQIFPEKLNFINALFNTKKHIINNDNNTCLLGIHLDLPFQRQGKIILERSEPFDDDYLEFLAPLIDTIEHVVNINELESSHSELDNVISFFIRQVPAPVAMFDTHMRHRFVSDAWKIMHNLSDDPSEYIGKTHQEVYTNQPVEWKEQHLRALAGETIMFEAVKIVNFFGKPTWLEGFVRPWYNLNGSICGIVIYSNFITELKENEAKLTSSIEDLTRSNQALERFAHVCSHDLKEPLRSISNFNHLIFNRNRKHFDNESLLYVDYVLRGIDRMNTLIKDILSYSKIVGQKNYEKIRIDVNTVVNEIKQTINFKISEIDAELNLSKLPSLLGEPTQIHQVFLNLINNAIKFRSEKPLVIDIFSIDRGEFYEFHVRDNGIGIEKEYHESIFMMFKRLHSKDEFEGSGIGLATCHKIINDHGGKIWVASIPGGGSDFIFTLPKYLDSSLSESTETDNFNYFLEKAIA